MSEIKDRLTGLLVMVAILTVAFAVATMAARGVAGDPVRGAKLYDRCVACHSLERNRTGPKHCGLIGRRAGSVPGFAYSDAMRELGTVWNPKNLDAFLTAPLTYVPGTAMGYSGIKDPQARADIIAYLETATADSERCR